MNYAQPAQEPSLVQAVINAVPAPVFYKDLKGRYMGCNRAFELFIGKSLAELAGRTVFDLFEEDLATVYARADQTLIDAGGTQVYEAQVRYADGSLHDVVFHKGLFHIGETGTDGLVGVILDITERKHAEDELRMNALVFEAASEAIMVTDASNIIEAVNPAFTQITGYTADEVRGRDPGFLSSGRQDKAFYAQMWADLNAKGVWNSEIWNRRKSGEVYPEWLSLARHANPDGSTRNYVAVFSDISRRKRDQEQLQWQANYDPLTELPNRNLLVDRAGRAIEYAKRDRHKVGLLFLDLDQFKAINDSLGHAAGDEVLRQVARRISSCVRSIDTVARFGGDEFVIVVDQIHSETDLARIATKILGALQQGIPIAENEDVVLGANIGATLYPDSSGDIDTMLRDAGTAMHLAKAQGRNLLNFFTSEMNEEAQVRLILERDLRVAMHEQQFELYYQPIVSAADEQTVAVEALVRWRHPTRGFVSPDIFIPIAEETGLIFELGTWILRSACQQDAAWRSQGLNLTVNVNLSARQLQLDLKVDDIRAILDEYRLSPSHLKLEITESLFMHQDEATLDWLKAVRDLGVGLAADDFGTGYSSLGYLRRFPINTLKIDREFVSEVPDNPQDVALVNTIIAMAQNLGMDTVAEGVETREQVDFMQSAGCEFLQGYYYSRPLPAEQVPEFYRANQSPCGSSRTQSLENQ